MRMPFAASAATSRLGRIPVDALGHELFDDLGLQVDRIKQIELTPQPTVNDFLGWAARISAQVSSNKDVGIQDRSN